MRQYQGVLLLCAMFLVMAVLSLACQSLAEGQLLPTRLEILPTAGAEQLATSMSTPRPSPTPPLPDTGWQAIGDGLEQRVINLIAPEGEWQESITILRLDPARFRFDVAYRPGDPLDLVAWQAETEALLVVNGGFFTEEYYATGLTIANGVASGQSYVDFGGMFAVSADGPQLRALREVPYTGQESFWAGLQSFPMLLTSGNVPAVLEDDGQKARRTVVAQDVQGRLLFLTATMGHFTLYQLSHFLANSDLGLDRALNLDGGTSTGMLLSDPYLHVPAFALLPTVITVVYK